MRIPDDERAACHRLCQSRKYDIGEGVCALVCLDQLGAPREKPGGCTHAVEVFKYQARPQGRNRRRLNEACP